MFISFCITVLFYLFAYSIFQTKHNNILSLGTSFFIQTYTHAHTHNNTSPAPFVYIQKLNFIFLAHMAFYNVVISEIIALVIQHNSVIIIVLIYIFSYHITNCYYIVDLFQINTK